MNLVDTVTGPSPNGGGRPQRSSLPVDRDAVRAEMFDIADREWRAARPARRRQWWWFLLGWFIKGSS